MSKTYKDSRNAKADRDPRKVVHFKPIKFKHDEQDWDSQLAELLNEHSELWEVAHEQDNSL